MNRTRNISIRIVAGTLTPGSFSRKPRALLGSALPFSYNDLDALQRIVREHGGSLAAIVMELTRSTPPQPRFLEGERALCDSSGARLVFDEVTCGFRLYRGGAHVKYNATPDMAAFAKALGNGHPIAAVIGQESTLRAAQESFVSSTYWTESGGARYAGSTP